MYCSAITTRLLVGILTPAMRATSLSLVPSHRLSRRPVAVGRTGQKRPARPSLLRPAPTALTFKRIGAVFGGIPGKCQLPGGGSVGRNRQAGPSIQHADTCRFQCLHTAATNSLRVSFDLGRHGRGGWQPVNPAVLSLGMVVVGKRRCLLVVFAQPLLANFRLVVYAHRKSGSLRLS